jgi:hypothetical protein
MKQDIDRLREKLGDEFELITQSPDENDKFFVVIAKKKDPWEGVEFAKCVINSESYTKGKIYKINPLYLPSIKTYRDDFGHENGQGPSYFKPSTESAYVEQLKAKVKELYGEIKDGDEFDTPTGGNYVVKTNEGQKEYDYFKGEDQFFYKNVELYCQGKWAKKIERVRVEFVTSSGSSNPSENGKHIGAKFEFMFRTINNEWKNLHYLGPYLAKCLEDKLNEK